MSNRYRDSMDRLHFTQEQKQEMVDRLMEAGPVSSVRRPLRFRRFAAVGVAAALALSLGVAGATGALGSAGDAFAGLFGGGPAETEIIDRIGYPIGASATSNGVTITADAIMGDTYSYAIVYSIRRDDGSPLVSDETLAAGAERDGLLPLRFRNYGTQVRTSGGGAHGSSWFYDADPADNAIQFVEMMTQDQPLKPGTASVKFQDLSVYTDNDYRTSETLAEGTWRLKFDFSFEDSSISLPAGQSFTLNGMDATLDGVTLSPLSIQVDYTVYEKAPEGAAEPFADFGDLPVVVTYTDGSALEIDSANTSVSSAGGHTHCMKGLVFETIRPLSEVASVTVGGVTISAHAPDEKE